jgi:hypothetical protein
MHIPRIWAKATEDVEGPERPLSLVAWGWGEEKPDAEREARSRLARLVERVRRGEPFPSRYQYGSRPLREEILQVIGSGEPRAIVTRNMYGAQVLNTARLLFLDVDLPEDSGGSMLGRLFGKAKPEDAALASLRDTLGRSGKGAFRLYRTAAGFRALAVDREYDPAGKEAQDLMKATGTDPNFVRLCLAQKSFRARLTPKPWRCDVKAPHWDFPREDKGDADSFAGWLAEYEEACGGYSTCRYLETVGKPVFGGSSDEELIELHDKATRATESLPLA